MESKRDAVRMENALNFSEIKLDSLVDTKLIQRFQDRFCKANHIYLTGFGKDAGILTERYGSKEELQFIKDLVRPDEWYSLVARAQDEFVENIVEQDFPERNIKMCALSTKFEGHIQMVWVAIGFLEEYIENNPEHTPVPDYILKTSSTRFYHSIEFLELLSKYVFITKANELIAQSALNKNKDAMSEISAQLYRSESLTKIVTMLESEAAFGQIIDDILREVCSTLKIPRGMLLRKDGDCNTVSMICEYCMNPKMAQISSMQAVPIEELPFFNEKNYVISADSMVPQVYKDLMEKFCAVAGVFQPIEVNGKVMMYLCFLDTSTEQVWETETIKFINDAKRIVQTILTKRIAKNSLASSYASLEAILENVGCGICVYDMHQHKLLYRNQQFKDIYSKSLSSGNLEKVLYLEDEQDVSFREVYMVDEERWIDQYKTNIKWVDGSTVLLCTAYDITEKKRYQEKIEHQANNDFLTGLYNRMRCEQDLEKYIRIVQSSGEKGALLYIDLDDFKHINDGLGHQYGDVLLKTISHSLQKISGIGSNCYRVGGDEFMVIITGQNYKRIETICDDIRDIFNRPWFLKGEDYYCTTSMGIVVFPDDGDVVEDLIRKADIALFRAKRSGKNCVQYYSDADEDVSSHRLDVEKNMRKAAMDSCDEFEIYYQPIIDVTKENNPCCGAEALIRWNSPELGFIAPDDFIPLAEYLGLINPIGDFVLLQAAKRCKYWNDMGHPNYKVNVNLSVVQLLQSDIVKKVQDVLEETRINPKNLTLEVTESLAINDMGRMKSILGQIRELGVRVALDDFGTGYSSLNHIREIPLDIIKIDRCFIKNLTKDDFSDAFVQMVHELAKALDLKICVEGVETDEQYELLKKMNIEMIQGFYFGKPVKVEEFEKQYVE